MAGYQGKIRGNPGNDLYYNTRLIGNTVPAMADFFISYTSADREWAEWIGHVLEDEGCDVVIQAWDFQPGSNFVLEMQRAAQSAERTIMVLSPNYLRSHFGAPEWAAAFAKDPEGLQHRLVPIKVRPCEPEGLLKPLVHIDLVDHDERSAISELLQGVTGRRRKPAARPAFPGTKCKSHDFPGESKGANATGVGNVYLPKVNRKATDLEKRKFLKAAFLTIKRHFKDGFSELGQDQHVRGQLAAEDAEIEGELFVDGGSKAACRIWIGDDFMRESICYAEGRRLPRGNSVNEMLSLKDDGGELFLTATMDMGVRFQGTHVPRDTKKMTQDQAADYLWRRFVSHLEA